MRRDFIIVVGNQGAGKSVWTKAYCNGKNRLFVYDPLASYPVDFVTDPQDYVPPILEGTKRDFRVGAYMPDELPLFGSTAFACGDCTLVVEECGVVFQRGATLDEWARRIIFMGRHRSVSIVLVAQRASSIPVDVRSQASRIVTFRQIEPDDVKAISERIGKQYREEIPNLPDLTCLDWEAGQVKKYAIRY